MTTWATNVQNAMQKISAEVHTATLVNSFMSVPLGKWFVRPIMNDHVTTVKSLGKDCFALR